MGVLVGTVGISIPGGRTIPAFGPLFLSLSGFFPCIASAQACIFFATFSGPIDLLKSSSSMSFCVRQGFVLFMKSNLPSMASSKSFTLASRVSSIVYPHQPVPYLKSWIYHSSIVSRFFPNCSSQLTVGWHSPYFQKHPRLRQVMDGHHY